MVLTLASTPSPTSTVTMRVPTERIGSVTSQDIVDAIKEARGLEIDRRKVHLDEPIRTVGTRMVTVEVGDGVLANVKTMVVEQ